MFIYSGNIVLLNEFVVNNCK